MIYDAVVIGGGPAGSAAGIALARMGWRVAIVEKSMFPRSKVCGDFISATSGDLLDTLGVGAAWRRMAGPEIHRVGLMFGSTSLSAPMPRCEGGAFGRALSRKILDGLLLDAAREAGVEVFQPWRAVGLEGDCSDLSVRLRSRERQRTLNAGTVIAAHGSWESGGLPGEANLTEKHPGDLLGFKAHFRGAHLPTDLMPLFVFPGGYGGLVNEGSDLLSFSCCIRRDVLAVARKSSDCGVSAGDAVRRYIEQHCSPVQEALDGSRVEGVWLGAGPIRPGIRPRFQDGVFRVGNAAGEAHPLVAEGISMALQSGWLLAMALANTGRPDPAELSEAGRRYTRSWNAQFASRVRASVIFARIATRRSFIASAGPLMRALPGLITVGARLAGKSKTMPDVRSAAIGARL